MTEMRNILEWCESSLTEEEANELFVDPSNIDLNREYQELNRKFFDGKLGLYPMKWNRSKRTGALVRYTKNRTTGELSIKSIEVSLSLHIKRQVFLNSLAHEMIHVFWLEKGIEDKHGVPFKREMNRINSADPAFDVGLTRNLEKELGAGTVAYKETGKPKIVIMWEKFGKHFGAVVGTGSAHNYIAALIRFYTKYSLGSDRCAMPYPSDIYVHSGGWVERFPASKAPKGNLRGYGFTPEQAKEIKEKGKLIGRLECRNDVEQMRWLNSLQVR